MADMEAVNSFNAELQSLYEVKPPISKGKMTSITRAALKAVKLYKHVVQSVEKFIQKCKAEYKIPGLYVIDSIIRQSRHQFGAEKDVFAPRFARNIQTTFVHLYRCPEEDKAKVIRVLNLWQKNRIFSPEVIQPLFDLADPQNPIWEQIQNSNIESGGTNVNASGGSNASGAINNSQGFPSVVNNLPPVHFNKKILDFDYGEDDDGGGNAAKNSVDNNTASNPGLDALGSILSNPEILRQLQTLQEQMAAAATAAAVQQHQMGSSYVSTPEQERQRKLAELSKQEAAFDQRLAETVARLPFAKDCELPLPDDSKGTPKRDGGGSSSSGHYSRDGVDQNSNQLSNHSGTPNVLLPPPFFQQLSEQNHQSHQSAQQQQLLSLFRNVGANNSGGVSQNPFSMPMQFPIQGVPPPFPPPDVPQNMGLFNAQSTALESLNSSFPGFPPSHHHMNNSQNQIQISQKIYEEIDLCDDSKEIDQQRVNERGRSKRSGSHDRHKLGRSPSSRARRSRSGSRNRGRKRYRSRSRERREEREKEKERTRKGLPSLKKEHLSVCSTTLWVGHLSKLVSQEEISDTFGAYGDIISIDLISPRGCAFIVMNRRQDAVRALDRLKNTKLQGKTITLAWAPGKGVKGKEWKDYWEVGDGVSYIPWVKLKDETNLEEFEDGGCMDEDTLPEFLKNRPQPPDSRSIDYKPPLPDNENSEDSVPPPLPPPATTPQMSSLMNNPGLASLLDHAALAAAVKSGDTDARNEGVPPPNPVAPPMPPTPFGMGPPVGMMPMGMNLMVPPPMLAMPGFQGLGSMPGMPMMGMGMVPPAMPMPPAGVHPPMGAPGLLGEIPGTMPPKLAALHPPPHHKLNHENLNSLVNDESSSSDLINDEGKPDRIHRGKKRSRFDDPDEKMSPSVDSRDATNSPSQDRLKDDRPVFERLKSLAEVGYSFANDKSGNSLLGTPPVGPRGVEHHLPNAHGFNQPPALLPPGPGGPIRPLFGTDVRPRQSSWFENNENPFLNPNPSNPFVGNPFIQANMSENPFEVVATRGDSNPFAANDHGGFSGHRGGRNAWSRDGSTDGWSGGGRGGRGRGGNRGSWRGRGGWNGGNNMEHLEDMERENDLESRGYRGRGGRGGRDNAWGRGGDNDRRERREGTDRPRSRDDDRSRGSRRSKSPSHHHRDNSRGRRRRTSVETEENGRSISNNRHRPRSRHRSGENAERSRRDSGGNARSHWQSNHYSHSRHQQMESEDWDAPETSTQEPNDSKIEDESWNASANVENEDEVGNEQLDGDGEVTGSGEMGVDDDDNQQTNDQWSSQPEEAESVQQQHEHYNEYNHEPDEEYPTEESNCEPDQFEGNRKTEDDYVTTENNMEYDNNDDVNAGEGCYNNDDGNAGDGSYNNDDDGYDGNEEESYEQSNNEAEHQENYSSYNDYNDDERVDCEQSAQVDSAGDGDNNGREVDNNDEYECTTTSQQSPPPYNDEPSENSKCTPVFSEEINSISSPLS